MPLFTEDSVLVRTEEGEAAAKQPRRVASNRARAALLLLDGQLSVGEMKRRFGESLEVEEALMELLRDGLAVDRDDSVTDSEEEFSETAAIEQTEEPPTEMPADPQLSIPPSFATAAREPTAADAPAWDDDLPPDRLAPETDRTEPELDIDASIAAAYSDEKPVAAPVAHREPPRWALFADRLRYQLTRLLHSTVSLAIAAGIGVLLVVLWHAPEWFRSGIEARAQAVAGVPVTIEKLGPSWNNGPAVELTGIRLSGRSAETRIARIVIGADWFAVARLGHFGLRARLVGLEGRPSELAEALNRADFDRIGVAQVDFEDVAVRVRDGQSAVLSGRAEMSAGVLQQLTLADKDLGVEFHMALPFTFPIEVGGIANDWRPPFLRGLVVESMQFDGLLSDQGLQVVSSGGAVHGGRYGGTMEIGWQPTATLHGEFRLDGVRMERMMPALRPGGDLEGGLSGVVELKSEGSDFAAAVEAMTVTGRVDIEQGRFGGLDVGAIMRERGTGVVQGGATRFDSVQLEVGMSMRDGTVRAAIRRFDAGNLHVGGGLLLRPDDSLSGRLNSTLSTGDRSVSVPVVVSGTLGSPALRLAPEAVH